MTVSNDLKHVMCEQSVSLVGLTPTASDSSLPLLFPPLIPLKHIIYSWELFSLEQFSSDQNIFILF